MHRYVAVLVALGGVISGCSGGSNGPPLTARGTLERAIVSTIAAPNFTIWIQDHSAPSSPIPTIEDRFVIQIPDRVSKDGTTIVIGSTGYREAGGVWTKYTYPSLATNFINSALLYVRLLAEANQVHRHTSQYVVEGNESNRLLRDTGLPQYQSVSGASFAASVRSGLLTEEVVRTASPAKVISVTISAVGSSPPVTAPASVSG